MPRTRAAFRTLLPALWLLGSLCRAGAEPPPAADGQVPGPPGVTVVFQPKTEALLSSEVTARVVEVAFAKGKSFPAGATLVRLDDRPYTRRLRKAEAQLQLARVALATEEQRHEDRSAEQQAAAELAMAQADFEARRRIAESGAERAKAEAALAVAEQNLAATERLAEDGEASLMDLAASRKEKTVAAANLTILTINQQAALAGAREAVAAAEARLEQVAASREIALATARKELAVAELNLAAAREELAACTVQAPFAGRVDRVAVNEHELVQAGQKLIAIVNGETLEASFLLPSDAIDAVREGLEVTIDVVETGQRVTGRVSSISAQAEPASRTIEVWAEVPNPDGTLRPGMRGVLRLAEGPAALPDEAAPDPLPEEQP
jgi:multidrug efflux pump subunit AcrA (membrane-fusion protein)